MAHFLHMQNPQGLTASSAILLKRKGATYKIGVSTKEKADVLTVQAFLL